MRRSAACRGINGLAVVGKYPRRAAAGSPSWEHPATRSCGSSGPRSWRTSSRLQIPRAARGIEPDTVCGPSGVPASGPRRRPRKRHRGAVRDLRALVPWYLPATRPGYQRVRCGRGEGGAAWGCGLALVVGSHVWPRAADPRGPAAVLRTTRAAHWPSSATGRHQPRPLLAPLMEGPAGSCWNGAPSPTGAFASRGLSSLLRLAVRRVAATTALLRAPTLSGAPEYRGPARWRCAARGTSA